MNLRNRDLNLRGLVSNLRSPVANLRDWGSNLCGLMANLRMGVVKACLRRAGRCWWFPWYSGLFRIWRMRSEALRRASFSTPVRRLEARLRRFAVQLRRLCPEPCRFATSGNKRGLLG